MTLLWSDCYPVNRSQSVQIESAISESRPVPWGVPQGSILGTLLFILYINELPQVVKTEENDSKIIIYADDNSPTTSHSDPSELLRVIQTSGSKVTD